MENAANPLFKVVYGMFKDNLITCEGVEIVECITYSRFRPQIEGVYGFYNLLWHDTFACYIVRDIVPYPLEEYKMLLSKSGEG